MIFQPFDVGYKEEITRLTRVSRMSEDKKRTVGSKQTFLVQTVRKIVIRSHKVFRIFQEKKSVSSDGGSLLKVLKVTKCL